MSNASSPTRRPVPKVVAAAVGGAAASIILWLVTATTGVEVPAGVAGGLTTLLAFAAGYLKSPAGALYDDADAERHIGGDDDGPDDINPVRPAYAGS